MTICSQLLNHSITEGFRLFYWRDRSGEVDFVTEYKGTLVGIEVKSSVIRKLSGIAAFNKQYPGSKAILVGDTGINWKEFLRLNPLDLF